MTGVLLYTNGMRTFFVAVFSFLLFTLPGVVLAEEIINFSAEYHINADASVGVEETIVYDFGSEERHGIFRTINTTHALPATVWYKNRSVEITDIEVRQDGRSVPVAISGSSALEIKIGDPDTTITGSHVYSISYTLVGALSYLSGDEVEFYWNVTGNEWPVSMQEVAVTVSGPTPIISSSCYVGEFGATDTCTMPQPHIYLTDNLPAGAGVTVAYLLEGPDMPVVVNEEINYVPFLLGLFVLTLIGMIAHTWRHQTYYHKDRPVIAEYKPYPGTTPMMAGVLFDDNLDAKDVSAGVVYLAELGFLKIRKTEKKVVWLFNVTDYEVELLKPVSEIPGEFLPKVISLFFKDSVEVGTVVALSSIKNDNAKKQSNAVILSELNTAIRADLRQSGFFENETYGFATFMIPSAALAAAIFLGTINVIPVPVVVFLGAVYLLWLISVAIKHRRRTAKGYEAKYHLKGFKHFLSVTDKERFDFHNAPERSPEQFMQYLPFAIAFGVEEKWAAVFADMQISNPSWYDSNGSTGAFAAAAFTHDLTSFTSAVTTSTQASSGGGSSGGGGGGGGGGSW